MVGEHLMEVLDEAFLQRTYRTTLLVGSLLTLSLVQSVDVPLIGGFASGVLIGVTGLWATAWTVDEALNRNQRRAWVPIALSLCKLGALYLLFRVLLGRFAFSCPALVVGMSLTMAVIVLKVLGRQLADAQGTRSLRRNT